MVLGHRRCSCTRFALAGTVGKVGRGRARPGYGHFELARVSRGCARPGRSPSALAGIGNKVGKGTHAPTGALLH